MKLLDRFRQMRRTRSQNNAIVVAVYEQIVAAARQSGFYAQCHVPDTPLGRFEMISLHMGLLLNAARGGNPAQTQLVQSVTEEFFTDVDHALRELGIGDTGVPKRMKKLASMFYGRVDALRAALDGDDDDALARAVARNIWPDAADAHLEGAARMVPHLKAVHDAMRDQMPEPFVAGQLSLPVFRLD